MFSGALIVVRTSRSEGVQLDYMVVQEEGDDGLLLPSQAWPPVNARDMRSNHRKTEYQDIQRA